eukprot:282312_1
MANYFHDEQVTWQKMNEQWRSQQNKMRLKVRTEKDLFDWEIPDLVSIKYEKNHNFGFAHIKPKASLKRPKNMLRYIGGVDISATKPGAYEYDKACAGLMIYEYPSMKLIHEETQIVTLKHPYIAGFLAFREVAYLITLVNRVKTKRPDIVPQLIIVDGNGILHYRRVGLATHLSMRVNIPCIGVAKKLLAVDRMNVEYLVPHFNQKLTKVGSFAHVYGRNNEHLAYALKSHSKEDVIYVSPGHMISLQTSLIIVMLCLDPRYKLPIPTEKADFVTRKQIYRYQRQHPNPYQYNSYHDQNNRKDRNYHSKRTDKQSNKQGRPKQKQIKSNLNSSVQLQPAWQMKSKSENSRQNKKDRTYHSKRTNTKEKQGDKLSSNSKVQSSALSKSAKRRKRKAKQWKKKLESQ